MSGVALPTRNGNGGVLFAEVSAKTGDNVHEAVMQLIGAVRAEQIARGSVPEQGVPLATKIQESWCCL